MAASPIGHLCSALIALKSIEDRYVAFDADASFSSLPEPSRNIRTEIRVLLEVTEDLLQSAYSPVQNPLLYRARQTV